jgi:hypothetical protein
LIAAAKDVTSVATGSAAGAEVAAV